MSGVAVLACALAFYVPALGKTRGVWPAPLDDVYIHFDFARSAANGHPFEWLAGNGYSSGGTSLTYPLVLAVGYAVGFRGLALGIFAALVAVASLMDLAWSMRRVAGSELVSLVFPFVILAVPILDWTLFSGMEVAFAGALAGRALARAVDATRVAPPMRRSRQLSSGVYGALLAVTRPECAPFVFALAFGVAHGAGSLGALRSLVRAGGPAAVLLGAQAVANRLFTGEAAAAGAVRKLVTSNPYASGFDMVVTFSTQLARLRTEGLDLGLGGSKATLGLCVLALAGVIDARLRRWSLALFVGAVAAFALVCLNTTAPFQNMRYLAPTFLFLLLGACLGLAALARRGAVGKAIAAVCGALLLGLPARGFARQIDHFGRSSRNIVEQQIEVGRRLASLEPSPRRVFVNDAGAIPYVSRLSALDGLGLGGFAGLPFARASVLGGPAVIELIERLPPDQRPDVLAIYDGWWPDLVPRFGRPLFDVTIDDNVICGSATKRVYRAEWDELEDRDATPHLDRLDVGDLVDESEHRFHFDGPHAGYVIGAEGIDGRGKLIFDAGRLFSEGAVVDFVVGGAFEHGPHVLRLRTDGGHATDLEVVARSRGQVPERIEAVLDGRPEGNWCDVDLPTTELAPGVVVSVTSRHGPLRLFAATVLPPVRPSE